MQQQQQQVQQPLLYPGQMTQASAMYVPATGYVTVQTAPKRQTGIAESYRSRQSLGLGISLLTVGMLSIIFNGIGLAFDNDTVLTTGHGFWCGTTFVVTGIVGIAARNKKRSLIITFMILTILAAILTIFLFIFGLVGASIDYKCCSRVPYAMNVLIVIMGVVAAVVSLWGSVICCQAVCCCNSMPGVVISAPPGQQQVLIINAQQLQPGLLQYTSPQGMPIYAGLPVCTTQTGYPLSQPQQYSTASSSFPQVVNYGEASAPSADYTSFEKPPAYSATDEKTPALGTSENGP